MTLLAGNVNTILFIFSKIFSFIIARNTLIVAALSYNSRRRDSKLGTLNLGHRRRKSARKRSGTRTAREDLLVQIVQISCLADSGERGFIINVPPPKGINLLVKLACHSKEYLRYKGQRGGR